MEQIITTEKKEEPKEEPKEETSYYDMLKPKRDMFSITLYGSLLIFILYKIYDFFYFVYDTIRFVLVSLIVVFLLYNIFKSIFKCDPSTISPAYKEGVTRVIIFGDSIIPTLKTTIFDGVADMISDKSDKTKTLSTNDQLINTTDNVRGDDSESSYCFVNKSGGTRNCMKMDTGSQCLSGEIFPSMDICINPNIRN